MNCAVWLCMHVFFFSCTDSTICASDQFRCSSGQCISASNRCDILHSCTDRSDEIGCSEFKNCSFITQFIDKVSLHVCPKLNVAEAYEEHIFTSFLYYDHKYMYIITLMIRNQNGTSRALFDA